METFFFLEKKYKTCRSDKILSPRVNLRFQDVMTANRSSAEMLLSRFLSDLYMYYVKQIN